MKGPRKRLGLHLKPIKYSEKSYREELAQAKAEAGNSLVAGIIRGLAAKESQRKLRIKPYPGKILQQRN